MCLRIRFEAHIRRQLSVASSLIAGKFFTIEWEQKSTFSVRWQYTANGYIRQRHRSASPARSASVPEAEPLAVTERRRGWNLAGAFSQLEKRMSSL